MRRFPEPGEKAMAIRQPTHTKEYSLGFSGTIPKGYGAGKVKLRKSEAIEVQEANEKHVRFNVFSGKVPEQFLLKRMGNRWMLMNITPRRSAERWKKLVTPEREHMGKIDVGKITPDSPNQAWQPKVDGASVKVVLDPGKPPRVFSYREAKNKTGLIEHTYKLPGYWKHKTPAELGGSVLKGEIYATDKKGKTIPAAEIGGLLNASVWNSRAAQQAKGVQLKIRTFGIERFKGHDVRGAGYADHLRMMQQVSKGVKSLPTMPTAWDAKGKAQMARSILSGKNKLTSEGLVIRDAVTGKTLKAKKVDPFDVYVREVVPGKVKGEMGAIRYSMTPKGKVVGNVGTGFSRQQRRDILRNPGSYIGRAAKVFSQSQFPSGALRAPVFTGEWHLDKGRQPGVEQ